MLDGCTGMLCLISQIVCKQELVTVVEEDEEVHRDRQVNPMAV